MHLFVRQIVMFLPRGRPLRYDGYRHGTLAPLRLSVTVSASASRGTNPVRAPYNRPLCDIHDRFPLKTTPK